jgi:hypothetical protein
VQGEARRVWDGDPCVGVPITLKRQYFEKTTVESARDTLPLDIVSHVDCNVR